MMRGTFANIRIKNHMARMPTATSRKAATRSTIRPAKQMSIYDAAMRYKEEGVPLVVFAGVEYGNGSSRDWAAKGTNLLGVRAVIAQSFERIHRSNLVGMGIVPFVFEEGTTWQTLGLKGDEIVTIRGLADHQAAPDDDRRDHRRRRHGAQGPDPLPHRYARRDRILQERRHSAVRAAQPGGVGPDAISPLADLTSDKQMASESKGRREADAAPNFS